MWDRSSVDFLDSRLVPWNVIPASHFGGVEGGRKRVLSMSVGGAESAIVRVTSTISGVVRHGLDLLVLAGSVRSEHQQFGTGAFLHLEPGSMVHLEPLTPPVMFYVGSFGPTTIQAAEHRPDPLHIIDIDALPWQDMEWRGDEPPSSDVKIKWLRRDEDEGLGIAFIVGMLPGYQTTLEEVHPVYEESFKLHGDLLLGRRGIVGPGGYFFRPPGQWHGPLYSQYGNVSIIRKDAIGSTDYRKCLPGFEIEDLKARAYVNLPPPFLRQDPA